MVLSFHPNIVAHKNILCAGRMPNDEDQAAICLSRAVILPQGCSQALYRLCRKYCAKVFPNYDARFDFPGKLGQTRLFQKVGAPFPHTYAFQTVASCYELFGKQTHEFPLDFPCVFKSDWGGEGEGVFLLKTPEALEHALKRAQLIEQSGQKGFLLQEYIHSSGRSLRVVVIGEEFFSYWRVQRDASQFLTNLEQGLVSITTQIPSSRRQQRPRSVISVRKPGLILQALISFFHITKNHPNHFSWRSTIFLADEVWEALLSTMNSWTGQSTFGSKGKA